MASWGNDPIANDDAMRVINTIRDVLDRALDPLRKDDHDIGGAPVIDLANQAGAIIGALGQQGIDVRPPNANVLAVARADRLNAISKAALVSEPMRRSGFPGERAAERWLRESGVAYDHWHRAAEHGDDMVAAWRALDNAYELLRVARASGGSDERLTMAFAGGLARTLGEPADAPYREVRPVLDRLARDGKVSPEVLGWLSRQLIPLDRQYMERLAERPGSVLDPRHAILRLTRELAQGGVDRAMTSLAVFGHAIPELPSKLRPFLDAIVESRLSIN